MEVVDLTTDEEIDAALERARHLPDLPVAISAVYVSAVDAVVIGLEGGRRLLLPRTELQGLEAASEAELGEIEIHGGTDIAWPKLDVDHYLPSLLAGSYGSAKWMRQLELLGLPDTPLNSPSAMARVRISEVSYSLFEPSSHVEKQTLRLVTQVHEEDRVVALELQFASKALRLAALEYEDAVDITLMDTSGLETSENPGVWRDLIGQPLEQIWVAINQRGYLSTVLLGFTSVAAPDVAITAVGSKLMAHRLVA